jgi:hypothetical protein
MVIDALACEKYLLCSILNISLAEYIIRTMQRKPKIMYKILADCVYCFYENGSSS